MLSRMTLVAVVLALFVAGNAMAADKGAPKAKAFPGKLSAKPADAAAEVLGLLTVPGKGKDAKDTVYKLTATGDVATQVTDLVAKGAEVVVKGTDTADTIAVTSIVEKGAAKKGGDKKKEGKAKEGAGEGGQGGAHQ